MSEKRYYFDTSIWLDFIENRNEPNMPKGEWAKMLVEKIIHENSKIIFSDMNYQELERIGYSRYEIDEFMLYISEFIIIVESEPAQFSRAKDLSKKRNIPLLDAIHALLARDYNAILITLDRHFLELTDIIKSNKPADFI